MFSTYRQDNNTRNAKLRHGLLYTRPDLLLVLFQKRHFRDCDKPITFTALRYYVEQTFLEV